MVVLPIVGRELRVAARRAAVYRLRMIAGLVTLGLGAFFFSLGDNLTAIPTGLAGRPLFLIVSVLLFVGAVTGMYATYDCISVEKREGTIGFLFLTDLNGYDIVLGKLFAAAVPWLCALLSAFPLLAASVVLGGVTWTEVWRTWLAILNLFFFAQSAAILASALTRDSGNALKLAIGVIVGFVLGASLIGMKQLDPGYAFILAIEASVFKGTALDFWTSLAAVHLMAWLFLAIASQALPRVWTERSESDIKRIWRGRTEAPVDGNPFFWLVSRAHCRPATVWFVCGLIVLGTLIALFRMRARPMAIVAAFLLPHALLKLWTALAASRSMEDHRRTGSLEMLLGSTSLSVKDVLDGQWMALRRLFLGPALALTALDIFATGATHNEILRACFIGGAVQLPIDVLTIGWLATWLAMSQKKPGRAALTAYLLVCAAPGLSLPFLTTSSAATFYDVAVPVFLWVITGVSFDIVLCFVARDKLRRHLREMASTAAHEKRSFKLFDETPAAARARVLEA